MSRTVKAPYTRVITTEQFADLTASLLGLPVSSASRGHGSALFLELGVLRATEASLRRASDAPPPPERGEVYVIIEWSWRVERARSIEVGSWSTDARIDAGIKRLAGPVLISLAADA